MKNNPGDIAYAQGQDLAQQIKDLQRRVERLENKERNRREKSKDALRARS